VINKQTVEIKCYLYLVLLFDIYAPVFIMDENSLPCIIIGTKAYVILSCMQ